VCKSLPSQLLKRQLERERRRTKRIADRMLLFRFKRLM
jgi:hypothetical protein